MAWKFQFCLLINIVLCGAIKENASSLVKVWKKDEWGNIPDDPTDIVNIMLYRFANKSGLTVTGFETFVDCSIGSTLCPFPNNTVDHPFLYLTDCEVNSALSPALCAVLNQCSSGRELLSLLPSFNENKEYITEDQIRYLLPAVLYQAQSEFCKDSKDQQQDYSPSKKPTSGEVWGYGILFVTLISGCSLAGVSVLPLMARDFYQKLLTVMIGLAVGSLAASAAFHLIPQAYGLAKTSGPRRHDYLFLSLGILGGIWTFFMIERILKIVFTLQKKPEKSHEMHDIQFCQGKDSAVATVAWMIIFGDGFHNFIDGVSIGAAFQQSILTGISISLAVMCEELPHELGDFAVLLNSGMTMKQALFYNFLSATTCYVGMVVGIVLGEFTQDSTYIFALAGGMFLYISLVDMLPEMNELSSKAAEKSISETLQILFLQNLGMFLGVVSLFLLAYYQDYISFE